MNGWAAVNFVNLQKDDTTFPSGPLTLSQATFMMSIAFIPSIIGNLVFPDIVKRFGCKRTIYAMGFPQIVGLIIELNLKNRIDMSDFDIVFSLLDGLAADNLCAKPLLFVCSACFGGSSGSGSHGCKPNFRSVRRR